MIVTIVQTVIAAAPASCGRQPELGGAWVTDEVFADVTTASRL